MTIPFNMYIDGYVNRRNVNISIVNRKVYIVIFRSVVFLDPVPDLGWVRNFLLDSDPDPEKIIPNPGSSWSWKTDKIDIFSTKCSIKKSFLLKHNSLKNPSWYIMQPNTVTRREYKGKIYVKNIRKISWRIRNQLKSRIQTRNNYSGSTTLIIRDRDGEGTTPPLLVCLFMTSKIKISLRIL